MRRIWITILCVLFLCIGASAQTTTPNLQLNTPPFNASNWNVLMNQNFTALDNVFAGITPTIWHPKLTTGGAFSVTDHTGAPLFTITEGGVITINGSMTCTSSPCGNAATSATVQPTFSLASGTYTSTQSTTLTSTGNTIAYCTTGSGSCSPATTYTTAISIAATETLCANAHSTSGFSATICNSYVINTGGTGGGGGTGGTNPGNNIGTITRQGSMSDGVHAFKTCYVGSSVCSGGVGTNAPATTPQRQAGLNTPSAGSGTANAVASYTMTTTHAGGAFTDVLWTTAPNAGLGPDTTSTNWYRDFYVKTAFPAGKTHFEFDTYNFDGTWDWMWGTQCNNSKNLIQYDNQGNGWVDTPIPCGSLYDGNWHHIQQTFHRGLAADRSCAGNTAPCQWWDDMVIDGTVYVISKTLPATTTSWADSGGQTQLDTAPTTASGGSPATATVYMDTDIVQAGTDGSGTTNPGGNGGGTAGTGELDSFNFDTGTPTGTGLTAIGSPATSTSNAHSAPNSIALPAGNSYYTDVLGSPTLTLYTRQYIFISTVSTTSTHGFLRLYHGGAELFAYYLGQTTPTVTGVNLASGSATAGGGTVPAGAIHLVETYTKISATAGAYVIKVDGTTTYTSPTNLNTGTQTIDTVWFGQIGNTAPVGWGTTYMDNVDFSAVGWIGPI